MNSFVFQSPSHPTKLSRVNLSPCRARRTTSSKLVKKGKSSCARAHCWDRNEICSELTLQKMGLSCQSTGDRSCVAGAIPSIGREQRDVFPSPHHNSSGNLSTEVRAKASTSRATMARNTEYVCKLSMKGMSIPRVTKLTANNMSKRRLETYTSPAEIWPFLVQQSNSPVSHLKAQPNLSFFARSKVRQPGTIIESNMPSSRCEKNLARPTKNRLAYATASACHSWMQNHHPHATCEHVVECFADVWSTLLSLLGFRAMCKKEPHQ